MLRARQRENTSWNAANAAGSPASASATCSVNLRRVSAGWYQPILARQRLPSDALHAALTLLVRNTMHAPQRVSILDMLRR